MSMEQATRSTASRHGLGRRALAVLAGATLVLGGCTKERLPVDENGREVPSATAQPKRADCQTSAQYHLPDGMKVKELSAYGKLLVDAADAAIEAGDSSKITGQAGLTMVKVCKGSSSGSFYEAMGQAYGEIKGGERRGNAINCSVWAANKDAMGILDNDAHTLYDATKTKDNDGNGYTSAGDQCRAKVEQELNNHDLLFPMPKDPNHLKLSGLTGDYVQYRLTSGFEAPPVLPAGFLGQLAVA